MLRTSILSICILLIASMAVAKDANLSLGLQRNGLTHTISASLLDRIAQTETPEDFKEVEHFDRYEAPSSEKMEIERPGQKGLSFYINYRLIHPLASRIPDHLIFVIPGFGSENENGAIKYTIELLSQWGYSVAVFDSPASQRFIEKTSQYGIPGLQELDASELYEGMKLARVELEKRITKKFKYSNVSVVGLSLGALNAQMVQLVNAADTSADRLALHRVIAVNPPIQNAYSLGLIDKMIVDLKKDEIGGLIDSLINIISEFPLSKIGFYQLGEIAKNLQSSDVTAKNAADLIAYGFSNTVQKAIKGYQTRHREDRRDFSKVQTFHQLFNEIVMRQLRKSEALKKDARLEKIYKILNSNTTNNGMDDLLIAKDSIYTNAETLKKIDSFRVITFDDDFLISDQDVVWLKSDFKAQVFSGGGGHLGGFYREDFQQTLKNELE